MNAEFINEPHSFDGESHLLIDKGGPLFRIRLKSAFRFF